MNMSLDCYPCFLRQTLKSVRLAGADEKTQSQILHQVLDRLQDFDSTKCPPEMSCQVHAIIREQTGVDPYSQGKKASTQQALALYPKLKALITAADEPLETAVRLSIAGNIIDLGIYHEYDLEGTIERVLAQPFAIDDFAAFREALEKTERILYLADNAGETVFDRLLIETINQSVIYAVRGGPVLNDATREDALEAGLGEITTIIDNGATAPGTVLDLCSGEFRDFFANAELIISKGQGNYESLSDTTAPVFFLLQAKCQVVAKDLGVPMTSIVLKQGKGTGVQTLVW